MNSDFTSEPPILLSQNKQGHSKILVHHSQVPRIWGKGLHLDVRPTFLDLSYQERWLPIVYFYFIHVNGANLRPNCEELAFGTVIEASRHLLCLELPFDLNFMGFLHEVPLI